MSGKAVCFVGCSFGDDYASGVLNQRPAIELTLLSRGLPNSNRGKMLLNPDSTARSAYSGFSDIRIL